MSKASSKHVVPRADGGWAVRTAGALRALRRFDTQDEALRFAQDLARDGLADLYVHGRDGSVVDKQSFDPRPRIRVHVKGQDRGLIDEGVGLIAEAAKRTGAQLITTRTPQQSARYEALRARNTVLPGRPAAAGQSGRWLDIAAPSDSTVTALERLSLPPGVAIEIDKKRAG